MAKLDSSTWYQYDIRHTNQIRIDYTRLRSHSLFVFFRFYRCMFFIQQAHIKIVNPFPIEPVEIPFPALDNKPSAFTSASQSIWRQQYDSHRFVQCNGPRIVPKHFDSDSMKAQPRKPIVDHIFRSFFAIAFALVLRHHADSVTSISVTRPSAHGQGTFSDKLPSVFECDDSMESSALCYVFYLRVDDFVS